MLNSGDWQAIAEVLGVILVIANGLGGMFIYRMQASFVTRAEHGRLVDRVNATESEIDDNKLAMSKLVTTDEMGPIYNRLGSVEQNTATMVGRLGGIADQLSANNNMLQLLVKNELEGNKK